MYMAARYLTSHFILLSKCAVNLEAVPTFKSLRNTDITKFERLCGTVKSPYYVIPN